MKGNAEDFDDLYPKAADAVKKNLYVDDSLNSLDDEAEAGQLQHYLTELMEHGGFRQTKWLSNSQAVMNQIPESDRVSTQKVQVTELPTAQALGVTYDTHTDSLSLVVPNREPATTPRGLLSRIATIWDPQGWLRTGEGSGKVKPLAHKT